MKIKLPKLTKANRKVPMLRTAIATIMVLILLYAGVQQIALWFDYNKIIFPYLDVNVESGGFRVEKRPIVEPIVQIVMEYPTTVDTPIKEYVCQKFDAYCKEALAVVTCESGWKEDALGINDPSVGYSYRADVGLFQINSVHWAENGGLTALIDPYHNTDVAYEIFKASGKKWTAWYAHGTDCYHRNLQ